MYECGHKLPPPPFIDNPLQEHSPSTPPYIFHQGSKVKDGNCCCKTLFFYCKLSHKNACSDDATRRRQRRQANRQETTLTPGHLAYHKLSKTQNTLLKTIFTHPQAAGLVTLPFALARLLGCFLPGRAIPSMLGVSHTARWLCACLHEVDISSCRVLDDVKFVSTMVRFGPWT